MREFNGRVGSNKELVHPVGPHGENNINNNGQRVIKFCLNNNMIVSNTHFKHKDIHKYIRIMDSRNERSIIDLVLIQKELKKEVNDVRVMKVMGIGSDYFMVQAEIKKV